MMPGSAHPAASQPDPDDVPGRPDFVDSYVQGNRPIPATAVPAVIPEPEGRRPEAAVVFLPEPSPEMQYLGRCFAYAYITPAGRRARRTRRPSSIRAAIGAVLPGLRLELTAPGHGADKTVRFRSPEDRKAAMERQPFAMDDGGASVELVREGETSDVEVIRLDTLAHVAPREYPRELRSFEDIETRCCGFGHLLEVDPACYAAPDLSPVRAVVRTEHARNIPRQVRIRWTGGAFRHVVPVQILRVWDWSQSVDADGKYVPMYPAAAEAP